MTAPWGFAWAERKALEAHARIRAMHAENERDGMVGDAVRRRLAECARLLDAVSRLLDYRLAFLSEEAR